MTRLSVRVAFVLATIVAVLAANMSVSTAAKHRKVQPVTSISKAVEKSFVSQNRTKGKESVNSCLRKQAKSFAYKSARRGTGFYKVNRSTVAKKCKLAHVYVTLVKVPKKSSKSSVVKKARKNVEYKKAIRSSKHKVYGAYTYRDKKVKGRSYTVLFTGQKKAPAVKVPVVPKPTPKPTSAPTSAPTTAPTTTPTPPTTAPTSIPTTVPTSTPTTAPTTAPTSTPTTAPTPVAPVLEDDQFTTLVKSHIFYRVVVPGYRGYADPDACAVNDARRIASAAAAAGSFTGIDKTVSCTGVNEKLVLTTHVSPTIAPDDETAAGPEAKTAAGLVPESPTYPTSTGARNIADALVGHSGKIAFATYRTFDQHYFTAVVVTFDDPRYTDPTNDPAFDQQVTNAVVAKSGAASAVVQPPDECIVKEMDDRAKSMATGQTKAADRQWDTRPLECPNLYKQFFAYSKSSTPDQIATDLTTGTLWGDTGTSAKDRIAYALTHDEGRLVTRSYVDYRGDVWTYAAVVLDDYPYTEPVRMTEIEAQVQDLLVAQSVEFAESERADGLWHLGDPEWTEADECIQSAAERWARAKAADKAKSKAVLTHWRIGFNHSDIYYGGKLENFGTSGCDLGYEKGFVIASSGDTAEQIVSEFSDMPITVTGSGALSDRFSKNWNLRAGIAFHLGNKYTSSVRTFRDFRGNTWTYAVFAGKQGDTLRLDRDQIRDMQDAIEQRVNAYRVENGLTSLPRRACMDEVAGYSAIFTGSHMVYDDDFRIYSPGLNVHPNAADHNRDAAIVCNEPETVSTEIVTEVTETRNLHSPEFLDSLVSTVMRNWKRSAPHNAAMLTDQWASLGVSVRNTDRAGTYIATVAFKR